MENFKNHFLKHKRLLEKITGKKYTKYKTNGQEFLVDLGKVIEDGTVKFLGRGTLNKGSDVYNIYRGNGGTIVTKSNGDWVTMLEQGKGMDINIQFKK